MELKITASLGLSAVTEDVVSVDDLIARIYVCLAKSKTTGKNCVSHNDTGSEESDNAMSAILGAIRCAEKYRVVKQPIFHLESEKEQGYEFLSRLDVEGFEMPDDFFKICLENNLLTLVDYNCLKNCVQASSLIPSGSRSHINLFPSTMIDIHRELLRVFPSSMPKGSFCVEISEQQILGDPAHLIRSVRAFKKIGVQIAIDDVGFGRSCLESLIVLEPDIIKVDKKWVNGISNNEWSAHMLKRLLKVASALNAEVVAEGIERREDLEVLKTLGVPFGQGYLLGRPA